MAGKNLGHAEREYSGNNPVGRAFAFVSKPAFPDHRVRGGFFTILAISLGDLAHFRAIQMQTAKLMRMPIRIPSGAPLHIDCGNLMVETISPLYVAFAKALEVSATNLRA